MLLMTSDGSYSPRRHWCSIEARPKNQKEVNHFLQQHRIS